MQESEPDNAKSNNIAVILFDLGGVLLRLRDTGTTFGVTGDEREFHRRWIQSHAVREFERGAIDFDEFASRVVVELQLPYDAGEFLQRFDSWPGDLYPGVPELLESLVIDYRVALLSNTNAVHWQRNNVAGVLDPLFDHAFLSFRTGLLKPDAESFGQVFNHYSRMPNEILFLDDNPLNVEAARTIGVRACLTRGIDDVRQALTDNGVT
jgi:putative hydrolase of the HAD superfamily